MTFYEFAVFVLASSAAIDIWRQGEIFQGPRVACRRRLDRWFDEMDAYVNKTRAECPNYPFWAGLLDCWYCLSPWVPFLMIGGLSLAAYLHPPWYPVLTVPVHALAVSRVVVLLNGLLPERMRHERDNGDEPTSVYVPSGAIDGSTLGTVPWYAGAETRRAAWDEAEAIERVRLAAMPDHERHRHDVASVTANQGASDG